MNETDDLGRRFGFKRVLNAMGMPTILGANTSSEEVRQAVDAVLGMSVEIDELQAAACRLIARVTGAEAGCVTSSCSASLAISAAAAITGPDLAAVGRLPDVEDLPNRIILPLGHDINFGAPISQMIRLCGAEVVHIGTANHCDAYHLRGALNDDTAAVIYVDSSDVNPSGAFLSLEETVEIAGARDVPVIVDTAAGPDVRPFLASGADLVLTSAHKQMGATTSGMICGKLDLVRACYLQNYGIGRAMKVGKEGVVGCMVAAKAWYSRDPEEQTRRCRALADTLARDLPIRPGPAAHIVTCAIPEKTGLSAQALANSLREGDPPVWILDADDEAGELHLNLSVMDEADAAVVARRLSDALENPSPPVEDVPYHDLYWSERRLLEWPNWR